ncbi:MAG: hypothetical protein RSA74_08715 [Chryseobacterium sp.]
MDGIVKTSDQKPITSTTVYLLKSKDRTIINYTSSNSDGKFSLKTNQVHGSKTLVRASRS